MIRREKRVYIESLGCNKNTVDSEIILSLLRGKGYRRTADPKEAAYIIVNTCAFIDKAKEEAVDVILGLARYKKYGPKLIVTGCFPQLYYRELIDEIPEVDVVLGTGDLRSITEAVQSNSAKRSYPESRLIPKKYREYPGREELLQTQGYAYLKISEGCSRNCSFCLIPQIKGEMRSRATGDIVNEAVHLEQMGVRELIIISQDTLRYGADAGLKSGLQTLINTLLKETGIPFIRLLYLRPGYELVHNLGIFENSRVLTYFDIPIQHVSEKILMSMNRKGGHTFYTRVIDKIRNYFPHAILRTTLIVGFPGESDGDFKALMDFIKEVRFNHLGVFVYSPQRETRAYSLKGRVDMRTAESRRMQILSVQQEISGRLLKKEVGKVFDVLIEERFERPEGKGRIAPSVYRSKNLFIGRSYHFAPEVDGLFIIESKNKLQPGSVVRAEVTRADDYDLHGKEFQA